MWVTVQNFIGMDVIHNLLDPATNLHQDVPSVTSSCTACLARSTLSIIRLPCSWAPPSGGNCLSTIERFRKDTLFLLWRRDREHKHYKKKSLKSQTHTHIWLLLCRIMLLLFLTTLLHGCFLSHVPAVALQKSKFWQQSGHLSSSTARLVYSMPPQGLVPVLLPSRGSLLLPDWTVVLCSDIGPTGAKTERCFYRGLGWGWQHMCIWIMICVLHEICKYKTA